MRDHDESPSGTDGRLRLADLLTAISLTTDLVMGHPPEEAMRTCLLATGLGRRLALPERAVADAYWTALLMHIGCTAYSHEQAAFFGGDDVAVNAIGSKTDFSDPREAVAFLLELGQGEPLFARARLMVRGMTGGERFGQAVSAATCEVAVALAPRLGLAEPVQAALRDLFERWDGKGSPRKLEGEAIALAARLAQLAAQAMVYHRIGGDEAAIEMVRRRAGGALDPHLAAAFCRHGTELLRETGAGEPFEAVVDAEPLPHRWILPSDVDAIALAVGDAVDLKSRFTVGHSRSVAELAQAAARGLDLPGDDVDCVRQAALFHDIGRVGIPNGILEKPGPLTVSEWEQVRLHPYHSERILARSPVLARLAPLAGMHHERLDGSGYYRGSSASAIPLPARILAAADAFSGLRQPRAHRSALTPARAADRLVTEAREGRLDPRAVDAVLAAAGGEGVAPRPPSWPAGLTDREVEVLCLLARGLRNREVAGELCISPKTVGHHVEHIYQKIDVSSRAAAALFAAEQGLLS
jgi:putative nucleotidyltransferase with HDIG domain